MIKKHGIRIQRTKKDKKKMQKSKWGWGTDTEKKKGLEEVTWARVLGS